MAKLDANKTGLAVGVFAALCHLVWAILVAIGSLQAIIDWILPLHFLSVAYAVLEFSFLNAVILVVMGFIGGYIMGWVFSAIWNWTAKK